MKALSRRRARLAIAPLLAAMIAALAAGPARAGEGPDPAAEFIRAAAGDGPGAADDAGALEAAWKEARARGETVREFVEDVLAGRHEAFGRGMRAVEAGDEAAAERAFLEALADRDDPFLAACCHFQLGKMLLRQDCPELAAALFGLVVERFGPPTGFGLEGRFFRGYALAKIPDREGAARALGEFLSLHPDAPERYRVSASLLLRELEGEGRGALLDLAEKMNVVTRLLRREKTDAPTQERQQEIVEILDRLIEEMRQREQQGQGGGGGSGGSTPRSGRPSSPLERSQLPSADPRPRNLDRAPRPEAEEAWGRLRDREREKVLQMVEKRFPARYRELLEQYFKSLAENENE